MKLIPYANLNFKTNLPKEIILAMVKENVEPRKMIRFPLDKDHKLYEGEVNENGFLITLIAKYARKYTNPVKGTVKQEVGGSIVNAKIRLNIAGDIVLGFCLAVLLFFILFDFVRPVLIGTTASINYEAEIYILKFLVICFFFIYVISMIPFWRLQSRIKKDFCRLFKTEEVEELGIWGERRKEYE